MSSAPVVRPAAPSDVPVILQLVRELAAYEREPDAVVATEASLTATLFGDDPKVWSLIVEHDGVPAGFVLWFLNFSTWEGTHGIYIEDLYIREQYRGFGYGRTLLTALAQLCNEKSYARLEWAVLNWNTPAHAFYRRVGAEPMDEWSVWRLTGDALKELGAGG
jgi:GNAT superfamily N-acetyltransferase